MSSRLLRQVERLRRTRDRLEKKAKKAKAAFDKADAELTAMFAALHVRPVDPDLLSPVHEPEASIEQAQEKAHDG